MQKKKTPNFYTDILLSWENYKPIVLEYGETFFKKYYKRGGLEKFTALNWPLSVYLYTHGLLHLSTLIGSFFFQ